MPATRDAHAHDASAPTFEDSALGEALVDGGWVTSTQLVRALAQKGSESLAEFMLRKRLVAAADLRRALNDALGESTWGDRPSDQSTIVNPPLTLIGPYRVVQPLARGGMGCVSEAIHLESGERVALKTIHASQALARGGLLRFAREIEITRDLRHPAIVSVHGVRLGPAPYLALEHLSGGSLAARVRSTGALSARDALRVGLRLCDALSYLHGRGILHRDLKPRNVLFDEHDRPRLIDFSLAVDLRESGERLTQEGTILGTPGYMAPEQARGELLDERADVYGLGAVLYYALTGRAPRPDSERRGLAAAILPRHLKSPRASNPQIPRALERVVLRALAPRPGQRFASIEALRRALEASAVAARMVRLRRAVLGIVTLNLLLVLFVALPTRAPAPDPRVARLDLELAYGPPVTLVNADGSESVIAGESLRIDVPPGSTLQVTPTPPPLPLGWRQEGEVFFSPADASQFVAARLPRGPRFFLARHEVTWGQYRRYANACAAALPDSQLPGGPQATADLPVFNVTWSEANAYAHWAGARLPSDAEWQAAYGSRDATAANLGGAADGFPFLAPAGSFPLSASEAGCLDMAGNVWEWVADAGPGTYERLIRGGGWADPVTAKGGRATLDPSQRASWLGFRICRSTR